MKEAIVEYLKQGPEGPYFNRMVETVLSRDKNWVRWKIENCPSIELPVMAPDVFVAARSQAAKLAATKRLRATPLGSMPLDFLGGDGDEDEDDEQTAMARLRDPERHRLPELASLRRGIADDEFEIEMPTSDETKAQAVEGKASKTWRALRIAGRSRLAVFDRIDDDDKIDVIFEEPPAEGEADAGADEATAEESAAAANGDETPRFPDDRRAIVVVDAGAFLGGPGSSPGIRSELVKQLVARHPRTFGRVPAHVHVARQQPREAEAEAEVNGRDCHFVDAQTFNVMRDGDQFLEFSEEERGERGDVRRGTSRRAVEGVVDNDRVPVIETGHEVSLFFLCSVRTWDWERGNADSDGDGNRARNRSRTMASMRGSSLSGRRRGRWRRRG